MPIYLKRYVKFVFIHRKSIRIGQFLLNEFQTKLNIYAMFTICFLGCFPHFLNCIYFDQLNVHVCNFSWRCALYTFLFCSLHNIADTTKHFFSMFTFCAYYIPWTCKPLEKNNFEAQKILQTWLVNKSNNLSQNVNLKARQQRIRNQVHYWISSQSLHIRIYVSKTSTFGI